MSVFDQLVGQEALVAQLHQAAHDPASMTHAWLFTGPPGSGRSVAARAFAAALQCEREDARGCGQCAACHTTLVGSHPDVLVVATSETFIRVDPATCATGVPGVYAIGEVAVRSHPSVVTAMADGVVAAANAEVERVLAEWVEHVGADRLDQVQETLRDLRELTDPWR